jgi:pilus assembly protein CpaB
MARMRIFIVFALAIGVGSVFAFATYNYVQKAPGRTVEMPTSPVVVAASNLDVGAELNKDAVRVVQWPAASVPEGALTAVDDVVGRGIIVPIVENEPILEAKLASKEAVDVVVTLNPGNDQHDITSKVILTNVQVLAAGTKIDRETDKDKPMPVSVVTLLVDPDQAERLTLAASEGKIQLALRNPLDKGMPTTPGVKPAMLVSTAQPARTWKPRPVQTAAKVEPPPPAPEPITVEIIRGDKRAREVVRQEQ